MAWRRQGGGLRLEVEVPVNTSAAVYLPVKPEAKNVVAAMAPVASDRDRMAFKVGSDHYSFEIRE
jgi:hypothetical protein